MKKSLRVSFIWKLFLFGKITKYDVIMEEGKYYGYPICCIKNFIELVRTNTLRFYKSDEKCFVPCLNCGGGIKPLTNEN